MSTKIKPKFSFKLLSVLLAVLMVASSFPVAAGSAFAADDEEMITVEFKVTDSAEQPVNGAKIEVVDDKSDEVLTKHTLIDKIKNTYETNEKGEASFEIKKVDVYSYTITADDMFDKTDNFTIKKTEDGKVEPVKVSMEYKITCKKCNGDGEIQCPVCEGRGKVLKPCEICNGTGYTRVKCPVCNGVDSAACERCSGKGDVEAECPVNAEPEEFITCKKCGGNKKITCPECNGSKVIEAKDFRFSFNSTGIDLPFKGKALNPVVVEPLIDGEGKSQGKITYSSNNKNIAVDPDTGEVTATKNAQKGDSATITAVIAFDKGNGYKAKKAEYTVTVVPNDEDSIENYIDKFDNLTYNGKSQEYIKAKTEGDYIPVDLKCQYYKDEAKEENKIDIEDVKNAGDYSVEVSDKNHNPVILIFTIKKAPLTIKPCKPNNENPKKKWGAKTDIKYDVYGAVNGETPTFKGGLSYKSLLPDEKGSHLIIKGSLELDESNEINRNYTIDSINPDGVEIEVLSIEEVEPSEVLNPLPKGYPESDEAFPKDGYWYNANFMKNNNKVVTITAKNKEYKICTKESELFGINSNSVTFTEDKSCDEVFIYVKRGAFDYCQTKVTFGIDTKAPKLKYGEDGKKPIKFVTQDESKNPVKILGRLLGFWNFFNEKITATVNADDENKDKHNKDISSGIAENSYEMWLGTQEVTKAEIEGESDKTKNNVIRNFTSDKNKLSYTLTDKEKKDKTKLEGNVFVSVKDNAGNELEDEKVSQSNAEGLENTGFMIENNAPYIGSNVETKNEKGETKIEFEKGKIEVVPDKNVRASGDVYSGDVTFKFTAKDDDSGLYNVDIRVNGESAAGSGLVISEEDAPNAKEAVTSKNYEVSTAKFKKAASYKIKNYCCR